MSSRVEARKRILRLLLVLFSLTGALIVGFWAWVFWGAGIYDRWNVSEALVERITFLELDEEMGWKGKPNFDADWPTEEGVPPHWVRHYKTDAEGFRDHTYGEFLENRQLDFRVWLLGDSSPFGFGCSGEETLAARMRLQLMTRGIGVRNYCVTGYNTSQLLQLLNQRLVSETPQILIVWAGFNDIEFTKGLFYTAGPSKTVAFKRYQLSLTQILEHNIPTLLVTLPHLEESQELERMNDWIRNQGDRPNVHVVDLEERFEEQENRLELYAPIDDRLPMHFHPSERGHQLAFQLLMGLVEQRL